MAKVRDAPVFFASPLLFRAWLEEHHERRTELLVGFHKRDSGKPSITWPESVDEALCFGWIDGVRKSLGADAYTIRFTPRKKDSTWSAINVAKVAALKKAGKMHPAGERAFAHRKAQRTAIYTYEQRGEAALAKPREAALRKNKKAAAFLAKQAPSYQRTAIRWVESAKKEETRATRFAHLVACCAKGQPIAPMRWAPKRR
jgi:uncharacterized protein YdeI (YjbR/CyaY-like superfamily)